MLAPKHFAPIGRYLDGIDLAVTSKMTRKYPPDETALTGHLCALMDWETQRRERELAFGIDALNQTLEQDQGGLDLEVQIDTVPHSSAYENRVSQADFGLVLEYRNKVLPHLNWSTAYLVQAKRIYPLADQVYGMASRFRAKDADQHERIEALTEILGPRALLYALYTPPLSLLSPSDRTVGHALQTNTLGHKIYDYASGLALHAWLAQPRHRTDPGIWMSRCDWAPTSLRGLYERAWNSALPFTWFFLHQFGSDRRGLDEQLWNACDDRSTDDDWVRGIVSGDEVSIDRLLEQLESRVAGPIGRVLPAHTITIGLSVGADLPERDDDLWSEEPDRR